MANKDWREAIERSNYHHKSFREMVQCGENSSVKINIRYPHIHFDTLQSFFMSCHALSLFRSKIISFEQYEEMVWELDLLDPICTRFYDLTAYYRWPQFFQQYQSKVLNPFDRSKCYYRKCRCLSVE